MECQALLKGLYIGHWLLVLASLLCLSGFEGELPPPISTPWGAYSGAASHGTLNLLSHLPS